MLPHRLAALALLVAAAGARAEDTPAPVAPATDAAPAAEAAPAAPATADAPALVPGGELVPITPVSELPVVAGKPVPDYAPPDIDGYLDASFSGTQFSRTGIDDRPTGYRFIAGFILKPAEGSPWRYAPEVAYYRIGIAQQETVTIDTNPPITGYDAETHATRTIDVTSLDFGVRASWQREKLELFGRLGLNAYSAARQTSVLTHYTPDIPNDPDRPAFYDKQPTQSRTSLGVKPFASVGVGYTLGKIPTVYLEYGQRELAGGTVSSTTLGVLMNF